MRKAHTTQTGKRERTDVPEIRKGEERSDVISDHCRGEKLTEILTRVDQYPPYQTLNQFHLNQVTSRQHHRCIIQDDTKKTGTFEKPNKN